jgi:hypothetical protein
VTGKSTKPCPTSEPTPRTTSYTAVDESRDRLDAAGWSVGEIATAGGWLVTGTIGSENVIHAEGRTQSAAWWHA